MTDQNQLKVVYVMAPTTNALALASLVLALVAHGIALFFAVLGPTPSPLGILVFAWLPTIVPALLAIIFGFIGISTANRTGGLRHQVAVWGVILGFTPMLAWMLGLVIRLLLFGPSTSWFGQLPS